MRLQWRNGFYHAVGFILVAWTILITQLPELDWAPLLPALVLGNLAIATFMFMAGLVLLEKGEGTLEAQIVTPLTRADYLISKVVSLTALSVVENLVIVAVVVGTGFRIAPLILGIAVASVLYCLIGFVAVARYDSINEFLFPSMLYTTACSLPLLHYAGLWQTPLMYLHPMQAPLVLLRGAFYPLWAWEWGYGISASLVWIAVSFAWSHRAFQRFVIQREGVR